MSKILMAMSGGVDSSVAALLLQREGHHIEGATLRLLPDEMLAAPAGTQEAEDAAAVCAGLGLPHHVVDGRDVFRAEVIEPFIRAYREGLTPNPCILCNESIKLGFLLRWALARGFDSLATGHYARLRNTASGPRLARACSPERDQSYALYRLDAQQRARACFPLGEHSKDEVRTLAEQLRAPVAHKPDSQDICFIRNESYLDFMARNGQKPVPGALLDDTGAVIGTHTGQEAYTIGQRKGLGGFGKPVYVLARDAARNTVTVGEQAALWHSTVRVTDALWHDVPRDGRVFAKLRYTDRGAWAELRRDAEGVTLCFDEPVRAPTPGQAAVWYDGELVLGGGVIALCKAG